MVITVREEVNTQTLNYCGTNTQTDTRQATGDHIGLL